MIHKTYKCAITFGGMGLLPQSRGGARFCTRGAMQVYAVITLFSRWQNRDTRRGPPAGAGAGRTADHLAVLFSQKVLAVRSANDIYRPVTAWRINC